MLLNLKRAAETHHATLMLLFEPVTFDLDTGRPNPWMTFVEETAREMKIPLVNVLDDMRARSDARAMFLENGSAAGHYSNAGHSLAADALYARMRELPPLK
jgi:ABC-type molybdate transport system ATPase subunit